MTLEGCVKKPFFDARPRKGTTSQESPTRAGDFDLGALINHIWPRPRATTVAECTSFCRNPELVFSGLRKLDELAAEAGRDRSTISVSVFAAPAEREALDALAAAGVDRAVLWLPPQQADQVLPRLDRYAQLLA